MSNTADSERAFWESAAVTALGAILATETQATVEESAAMAVYAADKLLEAWVEHFSREGEP